MKQKGFTLIETLIAIFILTMTVAGLITLASGGFFSVRYSRNQIVADALIQESLEYIRNDRDSAIQQDVSWDAWLTRLNMNASGVTAALGSPTQGCFASTGCQVDPYTSGAKMVACGGQCATILYYSNQGFYGYASGTYPFGSGEQSYNTSYVRTITATLNPTDSNQVTVTASVRWLNGSATKNLAQSIVIANWRP